MGLAPFYVCVHAPEWPAQALLRLRPELKGKAVAVVAGNAPLEEVCSTNTLAARCGIAHGMTRAELESFPEIHILRRSEAEEHSARDAAMEAMSAFTPRIEVQPARSAALDALLDMTGTTRMLGHAEEAVAKVASSLRALKLFVRLAAGWNAHTTLCLAPSARHPIVVAQGQESAALADLPLTSLPITPEQAESLELWGLRTLGELAALPEQELIVRLGQQGKRLRLLARGEHLHLMVPQEPKLALAEFIAFDSPIELLDSLLFVIGPMLDQILSRAQNHALALASLTATLGLDGGGEHIRTLKPALPVAQRDVLLKLLHLDLQAHPPSAGVLSIALRAEPGDRSKVQLGLFSPQLPEPTRLDVTLARIAALVGEGRAGRAALLDTHASDGFALERFTVPDNKASRAESKTQHAVLRVCRPPVQLSIQLHEAQPAVFFFTGKRYTVQKAFGPWRKSGDWWTQTMWSREEWDVAAVAGDGDSLLCVLVHDLLHKHWQMEALYD